MCVNFVNIQEVVYLNSHHAFLFEHHNTAFSCCSACHITLTFDMHCIYDAVDGLASVKASARMRS